METLILDATNSGAILLPGQQHRFTFSGTQGQRLYLDSLQLDQGRLGVRLVSPAGSEVLATSLNYEPAPVYLPEAGTYTGWWMRTGTLQARTRFRILDIAAQPVAAVNSTNSVTISPSALSVVRRFSGTAGQAIALASLSASGTGAEWLLVDPANQVIAQQGVNTDLGTNVLRVTGTYLIIIRGTAQEGSALNFQFVLRDVSQAPVPASGFNVVRSGNINPGETNLFPFTAPAGTPAYYDALVAEGQSDTGFEIIAPNGEVIVSQNSGSSAWGNATFDYGPFVLLQSGTYTTRIIGNSGARTDSGC